MPALRYAAPQEIGIDVDRLKVAYDLLQTWTSGDEPPIPGGAILVGRKGAMVEPRFFGRQGPEPAAEPIRRDGVFLLASLTKPVTYLAAMLLVERGLLTLADPVTRYIPEFAAHHKEATRVFHLFTHTSGLPDMLPNNLELRRQHAELPRFVAATARDAIPLFRPGTQVSYQSMGTLMVAEIIQRITHTTLAEFCRREIFGPLGMTSTSLGSGDLDADRLVRVQIQTEHAGTDFHWNSDYWRRLGSPWGGLFSTPDDYAVLCALMLDGGRAADRQLLSRATVERMTTNRLDDLPELTEAARRTQPWGLGWRINRPSSPDGFSDLASPRAFGHWGATGTMCWIDPEREAFCLVFTSGELARNQRRLVCISNAVAAALI
ncbi:MAG TPA: serine hydrolase domain-containing protein [Pirellulales bacterium]|nr:serine hydrolase domain-containing protein [Pirellulales bacterium]